MIVETNSHLPRGKGASALREWTVTDGKDGLSDYLRSRGWRAWDHESGSIQIEAMPEIKLVLILRDHSPGAEYNAA